MMIHNFTIKDKQLTSQQRDIAQSPYNTRMLIIAGPGTGKTHTLLHRLKHLVLVQKLLPFNEILVLSFSRAAIREIKSRVKNLVDEETSIYLENLNIFTFDSFSTRLLLAANPDRDLSGLDYDERIKLAYEELKKKGSEALNILEVVKHILVDEIQDLTGVRAQMVTAILNNVKCGFTLAGDPAQGIYDFQIRNKDDGITSVEFLNWTRSTFGENLIEKELKENFRTSANLTEIIAKIRPYAMPDPEKGLENYTKIRRFLINLPKSGTASKPTFITQTGYSESIAILCRLNAEVMVTADALRKRGIPAIIPPSSDEKGMPTWIGRIFSEYTSQRINRMDFEKKWQESIGDNKEIESEEAWRVLKWIEGNQQEYLNLNTLKFHLRNGTKWTNETEAYKSAENIIVTTIHQAKGREYDHVIILPPRINRNIHQNPDEECRVLYVAMTRARSKLTQLERAGIPVFNYLHLPSGKQRYLTTNRKGEHFFETGLPGDIDEESFVNISLFKTRENVTKIQNIIWFLINPGTELLIKFDRTMKKYILGITNTKTGNLIPLALMSNDFSSDLEIYKERIAKYESSLISDIYTGINVVERKTILLPPFPEDVAEPYLSSGFCVGFSIRGLLKIKQV